MKHHERLLVNRGAEPTVGSMAVQMGTALGAHVTALASANDLEFLTELGADEAFDYFTTTLSSLVPFDVILDLAGTKLGVYRRVWSQRGRMFCLALKARSIVYVQVSRVFGSKRVQIFTAVPMRDTMADLAEYGDGGSARQVIHSIYDLTNISEAHVFLNAGGGRGKRVVRPTKAGKQDVSAPR